MSELALPFYFSLGFFLFFGFLLSFQLSHQLRVVLYLLHSHGDAGLIEVLDLLVIVIVGSQVLRLIFAKLLVRVSLAQVVDLGAQRGCWHVGNIRELLIHSHEHLDLVLAESVKLSNLSLHDCPPPEIIDTLLLLQLLLED